YGTVKLVDIRRRGGWPNRRKPGSTRPRWLASDPGRDLSPAAAHLYFYSSAECRCILKQRPQFQVPGPSRFNLGNGGLANPKPLGKLALRHPLALSQCDQVLFNPHLIQNLFHLRCKAAVLSKLLIDPIHYRALGP